MHKIFFLSMTTTVCCSCRGGFSFFSIFFLFVADTWHRTETQPYTYNSHKKTLDNQKTIQTSLVLSIVHCSFCWFFICSCLNLFNIFATEVKRKHVQCCKIYALKSSRNNRNETTPQEKTHHLEVCIKKSMTRRRRGCRNHLVNEEEERERN